jgi:hypothetical protein
MRLSRAFVITRREWSDALANRLMLASLTIFPLFLVVCPIPLLWAGLGTGTEALTTGTLMQGLRPRVISDVLQAWSGMFLLLPVIVPLAIGAHSVVGEREKRTIEPLLSTPVEASEILVGKTLATIIPGLLITWGAYVAFCGLVDWFAYARFRQFVAPDAGGILSMLVLAPMIAALGNGLVVAISARVSDARMANQLAGLLVMPLMGFVAAPTVAGSLIGPTFYVGAALLVGVADIVVYWIAVYLFDRERLISTIR